MYIRIAHTRRMCYQCNINQITLETYTLAYPVTLDHRGLRR